MIKAKNTNESDYESDSVNSIQNVPMLNEQSKLITEEDQLQLDDLPAKKQNLMFAHIVNSNEKTSRNHNNKGDFKTQQLKIPMRVEKGFVSQANLQNKTMMSLTGRSNPSIGPNIGRNEQTKMSMTTINNMKMS